MNPTQRKLLHIFRLFPCLLVVLWMVPASCRASTEPELTTAIRQKNLRQVQALLSQGANINERDEYEEQTPLMWAAHLGDVSITRLLLKHGADVNAADDNGDTALDLAEKKGHAAIARLLIEKGARRRSDLAGSKNHGPIHTLGANPRLTRR